MEALWEEILNAPNNSIISVTHKQNSAQIDLFAKHDDGMAQIGHETPFQDVILSLGAVPKHINSKWSIVVFERCNHENCF